MKKLCIILFFLPLIGFGQKIEYWDNGTIKYWEGRESDLENKTYLQKEWYYKNGVLSSIKKIKGSETFEWINYYENGNLMSRFYWSDTIINGYWITKEKFQSWFEHGPLEREENQLRNSLHGPWTKYYPNGTLQQYSTYNMGKLDGMTLIYHLNGQVGRIFLYENGKKIEETCFDYLGNEYECD